MMNLGPSKRLSSRVTYSPLDKYADEVTKTKNVINLASGTPSIDLMPFKDIREAVIEVFSDYSPKELSMYPPPLGIDELRQEFRELLKSIGISTQEHEVIISSGSLHFIDLVGKVLIDEGDCVIFEEPTYIEAVMPLKFYTGVIDVVELTNYSIPSLTIQCRRPHILYTIPTSQNPTGVTYSNDIRAEIAEFVRENNIVLLEDDTYRFVLNNKEEGIINYCNKLGANCVYFASLSKVLIPSLRIAVALVPKELVHYFASASFLNLPISNINMYVVLKLLRKGVVIKRMNYLGKIYEGRLKALKDALHEYLRDIASWNDEIRGVYSLITVRNINTEKLFIHALRRGVGFIPGNVFFIRKYVKNTLRLSIAHEDEERIIEGIKKLRTSILDIKTVGRFS